MAKMINPDVISVGKIKEEIQLLLFPYFEAERIITRSRVQRWIVSGFNDDYINQLLMDSLAGESRASFEVINLFKKELNRYIMLNTDISYYQGKGFDNDTLCYWKTASKGNVCPDCQARGDMPAMKFSEWIEIGLPGEGATFCGSSCRCELIEV